jgi:para-aminobenzoate synthetase component 1
LGFILDLKNELNGYGKNRTPILFIISYDKSTWDIYKLDELPNNILYSINDKKLYKNTAKLNIIKTNFIKYKEQFNNTIDNIKKGNTYILNLTSQTKIINTISLKYIYENCNAKYRLYYQNNFLSFSPETFININEDKIYSYPMKGTINATKVDAKNILLNNKKELAEHTMIVDLLRNDLSMVSSNVKVENFRYTEKIKAGSKELYQTSSKISGDLTYDWHDNLGKIITSLLPAGSISGTPKKSTIELIKKIENYDRKYYTGIWGIYDGKSVDSAVLIRFIENNNGNYVYKSGGGITIDSDINDEYNEMNDKIYVP